MIITDSASAAAASVTQDWADSGSIEKQRDTGSPPPPPPFPDGGGAPIPTIPFGPPAAPEPFTPGIQEPGADPGSLMTPYFGDFVDSGAAPIQPDFSNAFNYQLPVSRIPQPPTWNSGRTLQAPTLNGGQLLGQPPFDRANTANGYTGPYPYQISEPSTGLNDPLHFGDLQAPTDYSQPRTAGGQAFARGIPQPEQPTLLSALGQLPVSDSDKQQLMAAEPYIRQRLIAGEPFSQILQDVTGEAKDLGNMLDQGFSAIASGINKLPAVGLPGATPGGLSGYQGKTVGESDPVTQFVEQSIPFILAGEILPAGIAERGFAAVGGAQGAQIGSNYTSGKIDGKTALIQLAQVAPMIAPVVGKAIGFGKALGETGRLSEERGMAGIPPEEGSPAETGAAGAGQPPPPSEPVTGGMEPWREAILRGVSENTKIRETEAAPRSAQLSEKAQRIRDIRNDPNLSPQQRAAALGQAAAGELYKAEYEPIQISPEHYAAAIEDANANPNLREFEYLRLLGTEKTPGALDKMLSGQGLQQNEEALLVKAFGPEMKAALERRRSNVAGEPIGVSPESAALAKLPNEGLQPIIGEQGVHEPALPGGAEPQRLGGPKQSESLEANVTNAMQPPASVGPNEQGTHLQPYADTTAQAADQSTTAAVNAALLDHQTRNGATPDWLYQQHAEAAVRGALNNPEPIQAITRIQRVLGPFQAWRSFITAFDNSFLGRQGWKLLASNTREWMGALGRSYQSLASPEAYTRVQQEVINAPHYELGQRLERPLQITTLAEGTNPTEEYLQPPGHGVPRILRPFERGFVTAGNYVRQMSFERDVNTWERINKMPITDKEAQMLADNLNNATGRGNIRALGTNASAMGQTFFSIRNKAGLAQFLMDNVRAMGPGVDPTVRRIFATRLAGWLTLNASILYAAKFAGSQTGAVDADFNPWSPTFGRITSGGYSYDLWGGYQPIVRAVIQIGSGQVQKPGYLSPQGNSRWKVVPNYIRSQLSPGAGTFYDFTFGKGRSFSGQDLSDPKQLALYGLQSVTPLFFQDVFQAWQANGIIGAATGGAASHIGIGAQPEPKDAPATVAKANAHDIINQAGFQQYADRRNQLQTLSKQNTQRYGTNYALSRDPAARRAAQMLQQQYQRLDAEEYRFWSTHRDLLKQALAANAIPASRHLQALAR